MSFVNILYNYSYPFTLALMDSSLIWIIIYITTKIYRRSAVLLKSYRLTSITLFFTLVTNYILIKLAEIYCSSTIPIPYKHINPTAKFTAAAQQQECIKQIAEYKIWLILIISVIIFTNLDRILPFKFIKKYFKQKISQISFQPYNIKKLLKYIGSSFIFLIIIISIIFNLFIVEAYKIEIINNAEKQTYYSYKYIVDLDKINETEQIIKIYVNHQKLWPIKYWTNFPKGLDYSVVSLKFKNDKLQEAKGVIKRFHEPLFDELIAEFALQGSLTIDGNLLKEVNLKSVDAKDKNEINYYFKKIDLAKTEKLLFYGL